MFKEKKFLYQILSRIKPVHKVSLSLIFFPSSIFPPTSLSSELKIVFNLGGGGAKLKRNLLILHKFRSAWWEVP